MLRLLTWFVAAAAAVLTLTLGAAIKFGTPEHDMLLLGLTMLASGLTSLLLALILLRLAEQSPRIGLATRLLIPGGLAIVVVMVNTWITASMMFISRKDLSLLAVVLLYAGVLAVVASYALAGSITGGVARLTEAVQRMAGGETGVRVPVDTADEVGVLADAFNRMAQQVAEAAQHRRELDIERRALLAAVSHDLRTPLSAIRAMLEAIEDGVADDAATVDRYHRAMQGEVARLSTLIDDLFEMSQIEAGALRLRLERVYPGELIGETLEGVRPAADRAGVRLTASLAADLSPIQADPQKLYRVFTNLIQNALRHTPPGGAVQVGATRCDGGMTFLVSDTGEGIAPHDLPHVFERFYRSDKSRSRAGGGAGLGLAIARGIVEAHGGAIDVESVLGEGTTFRVRLPLDGRGKRLQVPPKGEEGTRGPEASGIRQSRDDECPTA